MCESHIIWLWFYSLGCSMWYGLVNVKSRQSIGSRVVEQLLESAGVSTHYSMQYCMYNFSVLFNCTYACMGWLLLIFGADHQWVRLKSQCRVLLHWRVLIVLKQTWVSLYIIFSRVWGIAPRTWIHYELFSCVLSMYLFWEPCLLHPSLSSRSSSISIHHYLTGFFWASFPTAQFLLFFFFSS